MSLVLIFDCGATNLRTIAINEKGKIVASHHLPNHTQPDPDNADYHIWDFNEIWQKLLYCAKQTLTQLTLQQIDLSEVIGISVTTFGVDGAPFNQQGVQIYPIISWKCPRTVPVMEKLDQFVDIQKLYQTNGVGLYSFNTLFKLLWLKQHHPDIWQQMDKFVFISSMLTYQLTGHFTTDRTMAGTSMLTQLSHSDWNEALLQQLGLTTQHFPPMVNAGEKVGNLKAELAEQLGLACVPVISAGHDTQFAVFGSGAGLNQPVLSSGTWEILMARTQQAVPNFNFFAKGLTTELDAQQGCFNPAVQWLGSGIIEWIGSSFFTDVVGTPDYYRTMIQEAEQQTDLSGVELKGAFNALETHSGMGKITGLSIQTKRGQIYRAALQYMAQQLKEGLAVLQSVSQFESQCLICVGGGSKNSLWNQIRADTLQLPIDVVDVAESTVLGAAMFTFAGVGFYASADEAQQQMQPQKQRIYPTQPSQEEKC